MSAGDKRGDAPKPAIERPARPYTPEEGLAEARRRIRACGETGSDVLDLGGLSLTEIPEEIYDLHPLRALYLGGHASVREKPYWYFYANDKNLCNAVSVLPPALLDAQPHLQLLDLAANRLQALPDLSALSALSALTSLDLRYNGIGLEGARALASLTGLTSLDLGDNGIGLEGARALAQLTGLTSLDLGDNGIGLEGARAIASLTGLTSLDLRDNGIGDDGARAIASLTGLTSLDLRDNNIGDATPLYALKNLQELKLTSGSFAHLDAAFWLRPGWQRIVLHDVSLPGVEAVLLSEDHYTDCHESLQAHLRDRAFGVEAIRDVKLMVLGNGRVGKTQLCNRLTGLPFEPEANSTHGIVISETELNPTGGAAPIKLKIWDFGGQDIYLGTHALFLKGRAVFPIVWAPKFEEETEHEHGGQWFRNYPLDYWLRYVKQNAGLESPVLVIQTRCDTPEDEQRTLPNAKFTEVLLDQFPFRKVLHYSAATELPRGREALLEALGEAARRVLDKTGTIEIGKGRAAIKRAIEKALIEDRDRPTDKKRYYVTQAQFRTMCEQTKAVSNPAALLQYLHDIGTVFYRKGLFNDLILIDQQWALEAIYAMFERDSGTYRILRDRMHGRFTRSDLGRLLWDGKGHAASHQELFLWLMRSVGLCFTLRAGDARHGIEAVYIAPDLLPERNAFEADLAQKWLKELPEERAVFTYDALPQGLLRSLMARVGEKAGLAADYWQDGFYLYDQKTSARAIIEQVENDDHSGQIRVRTQLGDAEKLLVVLVKVIEEEEVKFGIDCVNFVIDASSRHPQRDPSLELERDRRILLELSTPSLPSTEQYLGIEEVNATERHRTILEATMDLHAPSYLDLPAYEAIHRSAFFPAYELRLRNAISPTLGAEIRQKKSVPAKQQQTPSARKRRDAAVSSSAIAPTCSMATASLVSWAASLQGSAYTSF